MALVVLVSIVDSRKNIKLKLPSALSFLALAQHIRLHFVDHFPCRHRVFCPTEAATTTLAIKQLKCNYDLPALGRRTSCSRWCVLEWPGP